jgi:hypothetical protein
MINSVTIAERGGEIGAFCRNVLLIAVLSVEAENIFDVMKLEFVFTGGCDGCAGVGAGALEALITIAVNVLLATERLNASRVKALDHRFEQGCM